MARSRASNTTDRETLAAGLLRVADVLAVMLCGYLAWTLRSGAGFDLDALPSFYIAGLLLGGLLTANFMHILRAYDIDVLREPLRMIARAAGAFLLVMVALVVISVLTKTSVQFSRIWLGLWVLSGFAALLLLRAAVAARMARWKERGEAGRRIAIVGPPGPAAALAQDIARAPGASVSVVGYVALEGGESTGREMAARDLPSLGNLGELDRIVREAAIDELMLAIPWDRREAIQAAVDAVRGLPVDVRLMPERSFGPALPVHGVSTVLGMPVIDLWRRPMGAWDLVIKGIEDRVLGALLLALAALPMALIAIAVRLDSPGPVFFKQRRAGFGQAPFTMYKFRSMYVDCDPPGSVPQARRNDPRVTRVGRILRRYSLDEVPQLINVLRGEMSLVGPRPHATEHDSLYAKAIGDYLSRQRVKPGMTGWAQIHGLRGQTETPEKMRQRVAMDLYYIDNWSLGLDLKILALTPFVVLLQDQAY